MTVLVERAKPPAPACSSCVHSVSSECRRYPPGVDGLFPPCVAACGEYERRYIEMIPAGAEFPVVHWETGEAIEGASIMLTADWYGGTPKWGSYVVKGMENSASNQRLIVWSLREAWIGAGGRV